MHKEKYYFWNADLLVDKNYYDKNLLYYPKWIKRITLLKNNKNVKCNHTFLWAIFIFETSNVYFTRNIVTF